MRSAAIKIRADLKTASRLIYGPAAGSRSGLTSRDRRSLSRILTAKFNRYRRGIPPRLGSRERNMTWMQDGESPTFDNADYMAAMEQVFPSAFTDALREQVPRLTFVLDERGRRASRN